MFQPLQPAHPAWVPRTGQVSTASSLARDSCPPSTSAYQVPAIITSSGTRCSLKSAWLHFTCDSLYEMSRLQWQLELWAWIETSSSQYPNLRPSFVWWSKPIQNTTVPRYFFNLKQNKIAAKKKQTLFFTAQKCFFILLFSRMTKQLCLFREFIIMQSNFSAPHTHKNKGVRIHDIWNIIAVW